MFALHSVKDPRKVWKAMSLLIDGDTRLKGHGVTGTRKATFYDDGL